MTESTLAFAPPAVAATATARSHHNAGLDALRGAATLLVVFHHTAITYGAIGGWYLREVAPGSSLSGTLLVLLCTVNQAFFMGLFFLLAGYYTPEALERKGPLRFLADRLRRLGLPLLFYGFVLGPLTIALAQTAQRQPFAASLLRLWGQARFEAGPLWFAQALLMFAAASVAGVWLARLRPGRKAPADASRPGPGNLALALAALGTGTAALALRQFWPVGVNVSNLQLGYFASYIVLYAFGCRAARPRWLERLRPAQVRTWGRIALYTVPLLPAIYLGVKAWPGAPRHLVDIVYALWEPWVAWGLIMLLLQGFQRRWRSPQARRCRRPGRRWRGGPTPSTSFIRRCWWASRWPGKGCRRPPC